MLEVLVVETGLFEESDQVEQALGADDVSEFQRIKLDHQSMTPEEWDALLDSVMLATTVITL